MLEGEKAAQKTYKLMTGTGSSDRYKRCAFEPGLVSCYSVARNNRYYRFLPSICELLADMRLLGEEKGSYRFREFIRDARALARLFESFLFNFYRIERPDLSIRKERIRWQASSESDPELRFLPRVFA
jgi:5-methylcytosine-specific restriction endonuclease McrBC regulatory subunit McrC